MQNIPKPTVITHLNGMSGIFRIDVYRGSPIAPMPLAQVANASRIKLRINMALIIMNCALLDSRSTTRSTLICPSTSARLHHPNATITNSVYVLISIAPVKGELKKERPVTWTTVNAMRKNSAAVEPYAMYLVIKRSIFMCARYLRFSECGACENGV